MKTRLGFVSNSSSSSYTCHICGETATGMDLCLSDADMVECVNGHCFCTEHAIEDTPEPCEENDYNAYNAYGVPVECCPICNFQCGSNSDLKLYLRQIYGVTTDEVFDELKKVNKRRRKLYDFEYVKFVYDKFNLTETMIMSDLKSKFKTYKEFLNSIEK